MTSLRGITWAHTRGYVPLVAASEAWHDLHPEIAIEWDKRSFWGFGEGPLDEVARTYDLVVFDHPFTGRAAARHLFLQLDEHLPGDFLQALANDSAGPSYASYLSGGHVYGLPIDAACQVAAYRPDLMEEVPRTWTEVLSVGERMRCAFSPMSIAGMFHSLCASFGHAPGQSEDVYVNPEAALGALHAISGLHLTCGEASAELSPVRVLAAMASTDEVVYTPLLYGYSNYSRDGYAPHRVRFAPSPLVSTTLGGAGLAISAFSGHRAAALEFAQWVAGPECQGSIYLHAGGQPGLRSVWTGDDANRIANGYFRDVLPAIERAYLRPTYDGFTDFQTCAAELLTDCLHAKQDPSRTIELLEEAYQASRRKVVT